MKCVVCDSSVPVGSTVGTLGPLCPACANGQRDILTREELTTLRAREAELAERVEQYTRAFGHTHQAFCGGCGAVADGEAAHCSTHPRGLGTDQCGRCGLDLRDAIHERLRPAPGKDGAR